MQMVKKSIGIVFLVWLTLLLFMPKEEMYYAVEKTLAEQEITLNEKTIDEGLFSLSIKDVTVYVKGIPLANIDQIDFFTMFFYNKLHIDNLVVDEALSSQIPEKTDEATFTYHLFAPLSISVDANGSFGEAEGRIGLTDRNMHIDFLKENEIEMIKPFLTKGEKGWFYEKSF